MRVKVFLHGHLRDRLGKEYVSIEASTAYEVLNIISHNYREELKAPLDIGRWKVSLKDYDTKESLYVPLFTSELHLYPIFKTAKSQWTNIAIATALIVIGASTGDPTTASTGAEVAQAGTATVDTVETANNFSSLMTSMGVALMAQGIIGLLFPVPKNGTSEESSTNSKYLGPATNTVKAGTRIPLGYGLFKAAGHFISYNVSSTYIKLIPEEEKN